MSSAIVRAIFVSQLAVLSASPVMADPIPNLTPQTVPIWSIAGTMQAGAQDEMGYSLSSAGDVNRDGYGDVIVGTPGWNLDRGRALLFLGSASGLPAAPGWVLDGEQELGILGNSVAGGGDINRDGYSDVIVGEHGYSGSLQGQGRARVYIGTRHGLRLFGEILGEAPQEGLGFSVAFAGDVNGDGFDDVLVGSLSSTEQKTRLYLGRPGRLDRSPAWTFSGAYLCNGIGDVNADDFADVGASGIVAFYGSSTGLPNAPSWTGPQGNDFAGKGDVNGDGYDDLVVGGFLAHTVQLYLGSASGLSATPSWQATDGSSNFGVAVSISGDVNGDGFSDIAVSSPSHMEDVPAPSALIYLGNPALPSTTPSWRGTDGSRSIIRPVALGADVDGDGSSEVLFGDPNGIVAPSTFSGRAYLYRVGPAFPAPVIRHEPATLQLPLGSPLTIEADIEDQTHFVAQATIRYRFVEDFDFQSPIVMEHVSGTRYRGVIPGTTDFHTGFVYSVRAVDDYGLAGETAPVGVEYIESVAAPGRFSARVVREPSGRNRIAFVTSRSGRARVQLFDVAGRRVDTLLDTPSLEAGSHHVNVDAKHLGSSGIYFYRLETSEGVCTGRIVQLR